MDPTKFCPECLTDAESMVDCSTNYERVFRCMMCGHEYKP